MLRQFFADKIVKHGGVQEFPQQTVPQQRRGFDHISKL
jgi:hypothetical protein